MQENTYHEISHKRLNTMSFFIDLLNKCIAKYNLSEMETHQIRYTYFFYLYKLRESNELIYDNEAFMSYKILKQLSLDCIKLLQENFYIDISHQYFISKFKEQLSVKNKIKDFNFLLEELILDVEKIKNKKNTFSSQTEILDCSYYILQKLSATHIPIELYVVLISDISMIYEANQVFFSKEKNKISIYNLVFQVITSQLRTIDKKIDINENDNLLISMSPPLENDLLFNISANTFTDNCSIKIITSYFGDEVWYKTFNIYLEKDIKKYFSFNKEPKFKVRANQRKYSNVAFKTNKSSNLLSINLIEKLFQTWENRLHKSEKSIFKNVIIPSLVEKKEYIEINNDEYPNLNLFKIAEGLMNTSDFNYENENMSGSVRIIESISKFNNSVLIKFNKSTLL